MEVCHGAVASMVNCGMSTEIRVEVSVEFSVCHTHDVFCVYVCIG